MGGEIIYGIKNMKKDNNTIVIDGFENEDAPTTYSFNNMSSGVDTITLDSSLYNIDTITFPPPIYSNTSITAPSTITWSQDYGTTIGTGYSNNPFVNIDTNGISVKEGGDIKIGGKSLSEAIDKIEERLGILNPNPELEERWDQLKALRKQYQELEKDLLEKEKIMKILKEQ
jgi:hypothetical protein